MREWTRRQAPLLGVLVVAVLLGGTVALAVSGPSTGAMLARGGGRAPVADPATPPPTLPPTPTPTPTPALRTPGRLGAAVTVTDAGARVFAGTGSQLFAVDGGAAAAVAVPQGAQGVAVSTKNPSRMVSGGGTIQVSDDGGKTWHATRAAPPGAGPYVVLLVSPDDPDVWFFQHGTRLLRTRDGGVSWRELTGLPNLQSPRMQPGAKTDEQVLVDGTAAVVFDDNGQQLSVRTGAPAPLRWAGVVGTDVYATGADGHVYRSTGTSWARTAATLAGPLAGAGGRVLVGDGGGALGQPGAVASSTDGATWQSATGLPGDQPVVGLATDRTGAVVDVYCLGGDVYRSSDGGRTFSRFSTALRG